MELAGRAIRAIVFVLFFTSLKINVIKKYEQIIDFSFKYIISYVFVDGIHSAAYSFKSSLGTKDLGLLYNKCVRVVCCIISFVWIVHLNALRKQIIYKIYLVIIIKILYYNCIGRNIS